MGGVFLTLFDTVHNSKMTKACSTLNEAEETRRHYSYHRNFRSVIKRSKEKWLVLRQSDNSLLESVNYSAANLTPILDFAKKWTSGSSLCLLASPGALSSVFKFHRLFQCPVLESPTVPSVEHCHHRLKKLKEEIHYLEQAVIQNKNLVQVADALANIQYTLSGTVLEFGMGNVFQIFFDEVHRSNMIACSTPEYEADENLSQHYTKKCQSKYQALKANRTLMPTLNTLASVEGTLYISTMG
jgi:predicted HAD superfamily Cof-like phosphohydrolase